MREFLESSRYIDWQTPEVRGLALDLAANAESEEEVARRCFHWVRDEVVHSLDHERDPVTCRASDVLRFRTGYCFAKSHLLAALLRANEIPAGLCYQRLRLDDKGTAFCLHGLNAVRLSDHGWFRVDPRGNKADIHCEFNPPTESLAYSCSEEGETFLNSMYSAPLPEIVNLLESSQSYGEVARRLEESDRMR